MRSSRFDVFDVLGNGLDCLRLSHYQYQYRMEVAAFALRPVEAEIRSCVAPRMHSAIDIDRVEDLLPSYGST